MTGVQTCALPIYVQHYGGGNNITTQVLLYETSNIIEIHTTSMPTDGGNHTMGIENSDGSIAFPVSGRNSASWSATNEGIRFTPMIPPPYTVTLFDADSNIVDSSADITVSPDTGTYYTVLVSDGACNDIKSVAVGVVYATVGPDTLICASDSVQLFAQYSGPDSVAVQNCSYTLDMFDSFGDGWNGGFITFYINGTSIGTYSASGSSSSATIAVMYGDQLEIDYTPGSWESENTYSLYDSNGNLIFSDGPTPGIGLIWSGTGDCGFTQMPRQYSWPPSTNLDNDTIPFPIATPDSTTTYFVTVSNGSCTITDSVVVSVNRIELIDSITDESCGGYCDGSAMVFPTSGDAP